MTSINVTKWAAIGILVLNVILTVASINMGAFAAKGPRYTALDGATERQERITSDLALAARIDLLHNLLEESCGNGL